VAATASPASPSLQETLLRAWHGLERFEQRASLRAWLYGMEPYPDVLLEGIIDTSPGPDARYETRETIELAFIAPLQALPPRQRAALVLRDVLGFHTTEAADMLDTSEDSFEADDVDGVVALLTDDAWLRMPPATLEYQTPPAIASFLHQLATWRGGQRHRLVPTRANTQPAFGSYRYDAHAPIAHATGLVVLTLQGDQIAAITQFLGSSVLPRFGLPRTLRD
jgi:Sigma-70, region 4